MIDIAEQNLADIMEACVVNHNIAFIGDALRCALNELLVSMLGNSSDIRESFEGVRTQVTMAPKSFVIIASVVARDTTAMEPITRYGTEIVSHELKISVKDLVLTSPSPSPSGLDSSPDEAQ